MRRTTLIAIVCAAILVGLGLARAEIPLSPWWILTILPLALLRTKAIFMCTVLACAGITFGLWHGNLTLLALDHYKQFEGQKVTLIGTVVEDPTYDDKGQLDFKLQNIRLGERSPPGVVRVKSFSITDVKRGDTVEATAVLRDGFGGYQGSMYYAQLKLLAKNQDWFNALRRNFAASIFTNVPEPQASLGLGFLIGLKSSLPDDLSAQLRLLGLTHIVVASGYNLTVLIRLGRRLFAKRSKFQALFTAGVLLFGFVAIAGFSPSMTRAALVTALSLWAWFYGRTIQPVLLLLFAAAITAVANPLFLWSDLGWWLSFLAFAGVLLLAPLLQKRIFGQRQPKLLAQVCLESIAAQIITLPLILWVFGDLPVLSLLANVLVVPLIPLAMAATFAAGLVGFSGSALFGGLVAMPATWVLTFMTKVVELLAAVPWANISVPLPMGAMLASYCIIVSLIILLWRQNKSALTARSIVE